MKKLIILSISIIWCFNISISQTYTATLAIGDIDISGLKAGDDVVVPVTMVEKSGGLVAGFQLYINYDHDLFTWKGSTESPLPGFKSVYSNFKYTPGDWIFNDNGNQFIAIWIDPALSGVGVEKGAVMIEIIFEYKGGLQPGEKSLLTWGDTFEIEDGVVVKGPTEVTSEFIDIYTLKYIHGSIFISK